MPSKPVPKLLRDTQPRTCAQQSQTHKLVDNSCGPKHAGSPLLTPTAAGLKHTPSRTPQAQAPCCVRRACNNLQTQYPRACATAAVSSTAGWLGCAAQRTTNSNTRLVHAVVYPATWLFSGSRLPEMSFRRLMSARTNVRLNSPTSLRPYTSLQVLGLSPTITVSRMMKAVHLYRKGAGGGHAVGARAGSGRSQRDWLGGTHPPTVKEKEGSVVLELGCSKCEEIQLCLHGTSDQGFTRSWGP